MEFLPREIHEKIVSQRPGLIRTFSETNNGYNQLLKREYNENLCNLPFTRNESSKIAEYNEVTATAYRQEKLFLLIINFPFLSMSKDNPYVIEFGYYDQQLVYQIPQSSLHRVKQRYKDSVEIPDFLQSYNIWSNRLSCVNLDPNYAKRKTLDLLHSYKNNYVNPDVGIDVNKIVTTYLFLVGNAIVFNIAGYSLDNLQISKGGILNDIEYLFNELENKILEL